MEGLGIVADGELYAVDVRLVDKVARNISYTHVPAAPAAVAGIANMKGRIVTLLSLAELLGRPKSTHAVHAVIFKPHADGNDQMGLLIDNPGNLITIDDAEILPPHLTSEDEDSTIISGLAEIDGKLYRLLDFDSIIGMFK